MLRCGFAGAVLPPKPGCRPSRGIYHDFAAQKINPAYNRHDVAEQLAAKRRPAGDSTEDGEEEPILIEQRPSFTLFAWKNCGFCTKAITALETRGLPFERIIIDKFSAEHAELAMSTGRCSVPYIFDPAGELLGGFNAEGELPGLAGVLAAMDLSRDNKDSAAPLSSSCSTTTTTSTRSELLAVAAANDETLPQAYFEKLDYDAGGVPWDLRGRPQPPVRNACGDGAFGKRGTSILDCGCGAGDNANWLAARGYDVIGFDLSASAVATAQARATSAEVASAIADASGATEFVTASATDLGAAERVQTRAKELGGFAVALDSAMLHCLDDESQLRFVNGVRPLMRTGGQLFVGCFSDANPDPWSNPRRISEAQLRKLLCAERGWRIQTLDSAWYERPSERAASGRGAWTMAWWCVAEVV